ncbi:MAG: hypothetical protein QOE90_2781 [Thermoplasmata archaeon]|jgi:hypothetical protein|nr:hypothetical protein [Thermoplasmata archaeon]
METHGLLHPAGTWLGFVAPSLVFLGAVAPEGNAPWNLTLPFVTAPPDLAPVMEAWRAHGRRVVAIQGANATLTWTVVLSAGLGGCGGEDGGTLHLVAGQPRPFTPDGHRGPRGTACV